MPKSARELLELNDHVGTLPEICMKVRMTVNGSSDELSDKQLVTYLCVLCTAVRDWTETARESDAAFDEAVWNLIFCTLDEVQSCHTDLFTKVQDRFPGLEDRRKAWSYCREQ